MLSFFGVILLAFLSFFGAHASVYVPSQDELVLNNVTSLLKRSNTAVGADKDAHPSRKLLSLDSAAVAGRGPASVVQDWSLVCKQLCGVGLGGLPCAPYCTVASVSLSLWKTKTTSILNQDLEPICKDLCKLQLGGTACHCNKANDSKNLRMRSTDIVDRNMVCETFCNNSRTTLDGCSLCTFEQADAIKSQMFTGTTPNWNILCAALCKTGDGGSLCNCDLSPFF